VARAANDLARQRDELLTDVDVQIARARADVERSATVWRRCFRS